MTTDPAGQPAPAKEIGVQRIVVTGGSCWLCGLPAVAGEKLPGRRHRVRRLCRFHDRAIFGQQPAR